MEESILRRSQLIGKHLEDVSDDLKWMEEKKEEKGVFSIAKMQRFVFCIFGREWMMVFFL
jgi:hypothetical protein